MAWLFYTVTLLPGNTPELQDPTQTCSWNATWASLPLVKVKAPASRLQPLRSPVLSSAVGRQACNSTYISTCFHLVLLKQLKLKCLNVWAFPCWHVVREAANYTTIKKKTSLCSNWLHIVKAENRFVIHTISGHFCSGITTQTEGQSHLLKITNSASWAKNLFFFFVLRSQHILFGFRSVWFMEGWGNERISHKFWVFPQRLEQKKSSQHPDWLCLLLLGENSRR